MDLLSGLVADVDWRSVLVPDTPLLEIFVRGTIMYLGLFILLRVILKRQAGTVGLSDLLVIVLIADAAQNGMADDYKSVPDGLLLVATLIFWNFALEWLGYHIPFFEKWLHPAKLALVKNGRMQKENMRSELITRDELMSQLREQGLTALSKVKAAYLEGDGKISVIQYEEEQKKREETQI